MSEGLYSMEAKDYDKTLDLTKIKPYGDTMNDGKVQLSFTLPVPAGAEAEEAAKQLLKKMGFENPLVVYQKELTEGFCFMNCYGSLTHTVDYTSIHVPKVESTTMDMHECDEYIREHIGRKIVIVGASTGTDAHTVGIDAIMNMKGYAGHYGLERYDMIAYPEFKAGDTITVTYRIKEGDKERLQKFRGVVIQISGMDPFTKTFTVRKIASGVGVERIFPYQSPFIDSIEVNKFGKVRRARIFYLRDLTGKKARIREKVYTAENKEA